MKLARIALCALLLGAAWKRAHPQETFRMVFSYDRPGLPVPHWQITVPARGPAEYTASASQPGVPERVNFTLSQEGRSRLAGLLSRTNGLQPCETRAKNLANMGAKVVQYTPPAGAEVQCTFNYTDNKPLSELADFTMAVANTIQTGLELDRLHRFDRLGLDAVMGRLVADQKAGRAVEVGAIRPTLESLATDVAVMERVRSRAQQLLTLAKPQTAEGL